MSTPSNVAILRNGMAVKPTHLLEFCSLFFRSTPSNVTILRGVEQIWCGVHPSCVALNWPDNWQGGVNKSVWGAFSCGTRPQSKESKGEDTRKKGKMTE